MKPFTESDRYLYPNLTSTSVVIDVGGYEGNWSRLIAEKYGCKNIHCYEPVPEFYKNIVARFQGTPLETLIHVHNSGIGASARTEMFGVQGDRSGIVCSGNYQQSVKIIPIAWVLRAHGGENQQIDLLKLNVEGCEFEILEALLDEGIDSAFRHIQVQPHSVVPNAKERWASIRNRLLMNFRITAEDPQLDLGWLLLERK